MNAYAKEILTFDHNAFRGLNAVFGFDFESPYNIEKTTGKFTINSILKMLEEKGIDPNKNKMVLVMKSEDRYKRDDLMTIQIFANGKHEIEYRFYRYSLGTKLDNFYAKCDFETYRKEGNENNLTTYVITQENDYIKPLRKDPCFDMTDKDARYKEVSAGTYMTHLETINKGQVIKGAYNYRKDVYNTPAIDKSGYLVAERRKELKNRALNLRKDRAKANYQNTDNTAIIKALDDRFKALKKAIIEELENATTYEAFDNATKKLSRWDGLDGIYYDLEHLKMFDNEKHFSSIASFNDAVKSLNNKIDTLANKGATA